MNPDASNITVPDAHALATSDVAAGLVTDVERGLSALEASRRLAAAGPNEVGAKRDLGVLRLIAQQFTGLVTYALAAATAISIVAGEWIDAGAITAIVLLNGVLGFIQEHRAERSVAALYLAAHHGTVAAEERQHMGQRLIVRREFHVPADELAR